jgi:phospholipid-binding lipoprotein MlaA
MRHLSILVVLLAVVTFGCAHKKSASSSPESASPPVQTVSEDQETKVVLAEETSSEEKVAEEKSEEADVETPEEEGAESAGAAEEDDDEDLDFLDEEEEYEEVAVVADPLEGWNRGMFHVNDKLYFWILKPVASGYKRITPEVMRRGVKNFFYNLTFPIRFVSSVLQAKGDKAAGEVSRFVLNTTTGVLGFGNPAKDHEQLNPSPEDLGQTFGHWGIGNGFYVVWPVLGPSTARDSVGKVGDYFLDPLTYVEPWYLSAGIRAYEVVNETSFRIGDYEALKDAALDPYVSLRHAYIEHRKKLVAE